MKTRHTESGFSLVEMAIVLAIVTLLLAGLLPTLSSQIDQQRRNETRKYMSDVRDALLGYAIVNGYLPCPDSTGDGIADASCQNPNKKQFGTLPYSNLGVDSKDAYGNALVYGVSKAFANSGVPFTLSMSGTMQICTTQACTSNLTTDAVAVIVSRGAKWATPSADETENTDSSTTGDYNFVSHDITSDFDDQVLWLSPNTLFNRMVTAGKLP